MPTSSRSHATPRPMLAPRARIPAIVALLCTIPVSASAQGWIEPRPGIAQAQWGIEKLRTTVTVNVADRVAEVVVEEWFRNNGGGLGEGDYVYPLPGEAVFTGYSLYQGEQELRGEMMDAARAREIYERIVRAKKDPALIELIGKGMMRARVFPIEPGQTRRITLRYTQVLDRAGDAVQFRYAAGSRHDARGSGMAPLEFSINVENEARFRDAFSPTHELRVDRGRGRMLIRPVDTAIIGDLAVFLPLAEHAVGITVAAHRPVSEDGYFMLTLSPGDVQAARVPRDVTVVLDVSGSMSGEKMDQAQRAVNQLLGTLDDDDRIRLIAFSSRVRPWRDGWTPASRAELADARQWVDQLRADGGTNIYDALDAAFAAQSPATRLPIVVFMTDGLPTNGNTRPEDITAMAESSRGRARVFAFGVGYDVNTALLDQLSAAARGTTQYVRPNENVEDAVSVLAAKVRHPVLTDLSLGNGSVELSDVFPRDLPDLFAGEELVLFGRYSGTGRSDVTVSGRRSGRAERYTTQASFPARAAANDYIPRLWASRKLGDLDRRIRSAQADGASAEQVKDMIDELRETALRYGLLSEYTSYLVQEPGMVAGADGAMRVLAAPPAAPVSGQRAVARAEEARRSREVASVAQMDAVQNLASERLDKAVGAAANTAGAQRTSAGRTFWLKDGVWVDAAHRADRRIIDVAAYSDAYFALIRALPEVELVLRDLDRVLVAGRSVSVRVGEDGAKELTAAELKRLVAAFR